MKAKILVLVCGGTMVMVKNKQGELAPPSSDMALSSIQELEPKLEEIVELGVRFVTNIDSSNMTPKIWDEMAQIIYDEYDHYDGFVITHGTDTMAYAASALSFALQRIGKPVVFTGAQIPGFRLDNDAKTNFVNAVHVASMDCAGVLLVFGQGIYQGTRVSKVSHFKLNAFESVNMPPLGEIGIEMVCSPDLRNRQPGRPLLHKGFDPHVAVISLVPGLSLDWLVPLFNRPLKGVVLNAYGTGNIPESLLPFLAEAQQSKLPIVIRSQCLEGSTKMSLYETGKQAFSYGVVEAYDMSLESTVTKFMWALDKKTPYQEMRGGLHENLVGEIRSLYVTRGAVTSYE